jgi:hypothetical protein
MGLVSRITNAVEIKMAAAQTAKMICPTAVYIKVWYQSLLS